MAKRKGLPKKYAKMGFKRGWAAYKRSKRAPTRRTYAAPKRKRVYKMARRKKYYRYARSGGGKMKQVIDGVLVGAGTQFLNGKIPYSQPLVTLGVGIFRNNSTLKTLGGVQLGSALLGGVFGGNGGGGVR
jgi:hypothetical protein